MDNQNLFSQSYDQIIAQAMGGNSKNFQMLSKPIDFNWPVAAMGQTSPMAYSIMSMLPSYSPIGQFTPGDATFFSTYVRLLSHVSFQVDPSKQSDLDGLKNQLTKAQNSLIAEGDNLSTAYQTAKQNGGEVFTAMYTTIAAWLEGPGSVYKNTITKLTASVKALSDQYATFLTDFSTDPTIAADFEKIKTPTDPISGAAPAGWTKVANTDGSLEWQPVFNIPTSGQDWRAQLTKGSAGAMDITLDASNTTSNLKKSWAGASASYDSGFWSVKASGSWSQTDIFNSDDSITVNIKTEASTIVPISAGSWYDSGLMRDLAQNGNGYGARLTPPWTATGSGGNVAFGKDGLLPTRITGLVVVYKPSYTLSMSSNTYTKHETEIRASLDIGIGPFTFGGSGGHTNIDINTTGNRTEIKNVSTSDDPLIIGVTVAFPGIDK